MFKALVLALALASTSRATVVGTTPIESLNGGMGGTPGTLAYALTSALTGTSSVAIDLSGTAGLWMTLTSSAASIVNVYFSNSNVSATTSAIQVYQLTSPGCYPIPPKSRYVSFYNAGMKAGTIVSAYYYPVLNSVGSVTLAPGGTVTANQGIAGAFAWPVNITGTVAISGAVSQSTGLPGGNTSNSWLTSDNYVAAYLTTTAAGTAGRGGSFTAVALTSTYIQNITVAAGVNAPCIVTIYPGNGANASFYWNSTPGSWTVAPNTPLAVSTTPIMFTAGIGDFLNLSVTGAALSVTAQVRYAPIY